MTRDEDEDVDKDMMDYDNEAEQKISGKDENEEEEEDDAVVKKESEGINENKKRKKTKAKDSVKTENHDIKKEAEDEQDWEPVEEKPKKRARVSESVVKDSAEKMFAELVKVSLWISSYQIILYFNIHVAMREVGIAWLFWHEVLFSYLSFCTCLYTRTAEL